MLLYHYTSQHHLRRIIETRVLQATESNVSLLPGEDHAGPDVVWLTSQDDPGGYGHGLNGSAVNKREVRVAVDVEDAWSWRLWAPRQGMTRAHMKALARSGGGGERTWYVVPRPIPFSEWVEVRNLATGEVLLGPDDLRRAQSPFGR